MPTAHGHIIDQELKATKFALYPNLGMALRPVILTDLPVTTVITHETWHLDLAHSNTRLDNQPIKGASLFRGYPVNAYTYYKWVLPVA